jgi:signal transduction histidine kinase
MGVLGLTNVARHAPAATLVEVDVGRRDGLLVVEVRDDAGGGADPTAGACAASPTGLPRSTAA